MVPFEQWRILRLDKVQLVNSMATETVGGNRPRVGAPICTFPRHAAVAGSAAHHQRTADVAGGRIAHLRAANVLVVLQADGIVSEFWMGRGQRPMNTTSGRPQKPTSAHRAFFVQVDFRGSRDPTRIGHNCELALRDVLGTDRQLPIAQDELTLKRKTSAQAAEGSFRAAGGWTP